MPDRPNARPHAPFRSAVDLRTFMALEFPPVRERVEGVLPVEGFGLLLAAEKTGKSLLQDQLALCVSAGLPFLGRRTEAGAVLRIEEEGTELDQQDRLRSQLTALGLADADLPLHIVVGSGYRLDDPASVEALDDEIVRTGAQMVILGPLSRLAGVEDENRATEFNAISRTLSELARRHQLLVVLAHHRRKDDRRAGPPRTVRAFFESVRGSNALTGAMDAGIGLLRDPEEPDGTMYVMRRNGPAETFGVRLDVDTLLFSARDIAPPTERPTLDEVMAAVATGAPASLTRVEVARIVGCSPNTARDRLERLVADRRLLRSTGARSAVLYSLIAPVTSPGP